MAPWHTNCWGTTLRDEKFCPTPFNMRYSNDPFLEEVSVAKVPISYHIIYSQMYLLQPEFYGSHVTSTIFISFHSNYNLNVVTVWPLHTFKRINSLKRMLDKRL